MQRHGFLLGIIATGGQVLLLRELISTLQGNELFIGTTLAGWLLWGAAGAFVGGKIKSSTSPKTLFILAALLVPMMVAFGRLSPLLITHTMGEPIAFSVAAAISMLVTLPSALVCGWLFTAIVRRQGADVTAMVSVYYYEAAGAFTACAIVAILTTFNISTLSIAGGLCSLSVAILLLPSRVTALRGAVTATGGILLAVGFIVIGPRIDHAIDGCKYRPYDLVATYDTPYSHQTVLFRDGVRVALTDNTVESVEGDILTAEDILLPPLAYAPDARQVLIVGQIDLTLISLLPNLPKLSVTEVDPRPSLRDQVSYTVPESTFRYVQDDPSEYLRSQRAGSMDVVISVLSGSGSHLGSRLITEPRLHEIRRVLRPGGIFHLVTSYDSDRFVTRDDERLLSVIRKTLEATFPHVIIWPGTNTLFLAGDSTLPVLAVDSIIARLDQLTYRAQFVNVSYLEDRLNSEQMERIDSATAQPCQANSLERPILTNLEIAQRGRIRSVDRWVSSLMKNWGWEVSLALLLAVIVVLLSLGRSAVSYGASLYIFAGLTSIMLELISFYVYQSTVGMLYSHLSLLVGGFMLGLAVGARIAITARCPRLELLALTTMVIAPLIMATFGLLIPTPLALIFHVCFQFAIAFSTGALFVSATRRFYQTPTRNRGLGYALELCGSAVTALITIPLLLPALGLKWLLAVTAIIAGLLLLLSLRLRRLTDR